MYVHRKGQPSRRTAAAVQQPRVIDTPLRKMLQHKAGCTRCFWGNTALRE